MNYMFAQTARIALVFISRVNMNGMISKTYICDFVATFYNLVILADHFIVTN